MSLSSMLSRSGSSDALRADLERLTSVVSAGMASFGAVGDALAEIRDRELYKGVAASFDEYCLMAWNMTRQHAGRLIDAANVCRNLAPTGSVPSSERQARALRGLSEEDQVAAWMEAREDSEPMGSVSTPKLEAAAAKRKQKKTRKTLKPIRIRAAGAWVIIEPNKKFSDVITSLESALVIAKERAEPGRKAAA